MDDEKKKDISELTQEALTAANSPLSLDNLSPTRGVAFNSPQPSPVPSVTILDSSTPELKPTASDLKISDLIDQISKLNESTVGESAFKAEQETAAGIPELKKTQADLSARLKLLQNEALAIPLQLQQEFAGRGATAGGVKPFEDAALRRNAIQALSVSAFLEASKGNLTLANDLVEQAVAAEYEPRKEKLRVETANLELFLKDPLRTLDEKNRAQAQLDAKAKKDEKIKQEEAEQKNIYNLAMKAAENGADAVTLQRIQSSTTTTDAIINAGTFLRGKPSTSIIEAGGRKLLINAETGETIKDLGGVSIKGAGSPVYQSEFDSAVAYVETYGGQYSDNELRLALKRDATKLTDADIDDIIAGRPKTIKISQIKSALMQDPKTVREYLLKKYTTDELKKKAKAAGYTAGGFLGFGVGQAGIDQFLASDKAINLINEAVNLAVEDYKKSYELAGYKIIE